MYVSVESMSRGKWIEQLWGKKLFFSLVVLVCVCFSTIFQRDVVQTVYFQGRVGSDMSKRGRCLET